MSAFDQYIFYIFIFSPLCAAIFIMLIPASDTASKLTVSKFFSSVTALAVARVSFLFLEQKIATESAISFSVMTLNVNFILHLTKYNLFLFGLGAASLLIYTFSNQLDDAKTNIHHVAPFIVAFLLFVSFGQIDLRVALPILSIANFLMYFLIGFTDKIRRGSTIFQMGIFLFSCDALALVLMQIPFANITSPNVSFAINLFMLIPGFSRIALPIFAPYMKKLILNVDDYEGAFLIIFLQLSGFFILILTRSNFTTLPDSLSFTLAAASVVGAIIIACFAITDHSMKTLPYFFLIHHSSLASASLFFSLENDVWFYAITLLASAIICFFYAARFLTLFRQYRIQPSSLPVLRATWFLHLSLLAGLPGLGVGVSLWLLIYRLVSLGIFSSRDALWRVLGLLWLLSLIILIYALVLSVQKEIFVLSDQKTIFDNRPLIKRTLFITPMLAALVSWLLPIATFFAKTKIK